MRASRIGLVLLMGALALLVSTCSDDDPSRPGCELTVTAPNGGEVWSADSVCTLAWASGGPCGAQVSIELLRDDGVCRTIAAATDNDGAYDWVCRPCGADSGGYRIRVAATGGSQADMSDGEFTIRFGPQERCEIALTAPLGGERVLSGETLTIAWQAGPACGDSVRIELLHGGQSCHTIAAATDAAGTYGWIAAPCSADSTGYAIRVTDLGSAETDESPGTFVIAIPEEEEPCALSLLAPDGGESYTVGDAVGITWSSTGECAASVAVELLRDGAACATISSGTPNDGTFEWTAAQCGSETAGYTIRVSEVGGTAQGTSAGSFAITAAPVPCELDVTTPAGGASCVVGDAVTIEWSSPGECAESVSLELLREGAACAMISSGTPNDGTFEWTAAQCGSETAGYTIRVSEVGGTAQGTSAGSFAITAAPVPCSLMILGPNGGESVLVGENVAIAWESSGDCAASVTIELLRDGAVCATIAGDSPNDGAFDWTATRCGAESGGYTIRVSELSGTAQDASDGTFTINPITVPCELGILSPDGGEELCIGRSTTITWTSEGSCGGWVEIELLLDGDVCLPITASTENDGHFAWTVQRCGQEPAGYRVRVTEHAGGTTSESAGTFSITTPCAVMTSAPNGGESYCEGDDVPLSWTSSGCCGETVKLELLHAGVVCATIADETENDGRHTWPAVPCGGDVAGYTLRVTDLDSGATDESDAGWSITPACALALTYPVGGEAFCLGDAVEITWTSAGCCGETVRIELLLSGIVCRTLAEGAPNSGSYAWPAAQCSAQETGYAIRVTAAGSGQSSQSPDTFTVLSGCALTVTEPTSGAIVCVSEEMEILWNANICCGPAVRIELLREGQPCTTISATTENDGEHSWPAAQCGGASEGYRVRVTEIDGGAVGESPGTFRIVGNCQLTLREPNGGTTYCDGEEVQVSWEGGECCGAEVKLELLYAGTVCRTIDESAPNTGSYVFTVQSCGPEVDGYRVRVTDLDSGANDMSDNPFAVEDAPCALQVTSPNGGDRLHPDDPVTITWTASLCCGATVRLDLYRNGTLCRTLAPATANDESYDWVAERCDDELTGYKIRVTDTSSGLWDESDAAFAIDSYLICADGSGDFVTIQAALTAVPEGKIIELCDGVFTGSDNRDLDFQGKALTLRSRSGDPELCVIDCEGTGSGLVFDSGEGSDTVVEGIGIRNATSGGIRCLAGTAPTLQNCRISSCSAANRNGAGIECVGSSPTFSDCEITSNIAAGTGRGAGASCSNSTITFQRCRITSNHGHAAGAGIYASGSSLVITDCQFADNATEGEGEVGGAVHLLQGAAVLERCTFELNVSSGYGGAAFAQLLSSLEILACDFRENRALAGGAIHCNSRCVVEDCTFQGNHARDLGGAVALRHWDMDSGEQRFTRCEFTNNGVYGEWGVAGAWFAGRTGPTITARCVECTFSGNTAWNAGAAYVDTGPGALWFDACRFLDNAATGGAGWAGYGGALCVRGGAGNVRVQAEHGACEFRDNSAGSGGAVEVWDTNSEGAIEIEGAIFSGNTATHEDGGALLVSGSQAAVVTGCEFEDNIAAGEGGAVSLSGGAGWASSFTDCNFDSNESGLAGGGVFCNVPAGARDEDDSPAPLLSDCQFMDNTAPVGGGARFMIPLSKELVLSGCYIGTSVATDHGGGLAVSGEGKLTLETCNLSGNCAPTGGAIHMQDPALLYVSDSRFENNGASTAGAAIYSAGRTVSLLRCDLLENGLMTKQVAYDPPPSYGGGIYCAGELLEVAECRFDRNLAAICGGAIYITGASFAAADCEFNGNQATRDGGAVCCTANRRTAMNLCRFQANMAGGDGGAFHLSSDLGGAVAYIDECTFLRNSAGDDGGAGNTRGNCAYEFGKCTFSENTGTDNGGAIYAYGSADLELQHCTLNENSAPRGGCLSLNNSCTAVLDHTILAFSPVGEAMYCVSSTADAMCSDVYGNAGGNWTGCLSGQQGGDGNMEADPLFCDPANDDLTLHRASPCDSENHPPGGCLRIGAHNVGCD